MKRTLEIKGEPEKVTKILTSLRSDSFFSKTFEGTAKNGILEGHYTALGFLRGYVVGFVKINGMYDKTRGDIRLMTVPSNVFWISFIFSFLAMGILFYVGVTKNSAALIGAILFLVLALVYAIAFLIESHVFLKRLRRLITTQQ